MPRRRSSVWGLESQGALLGGRHFIAGGGQQSLWLPKSPCLGWDVPSLEVFSDWSLEQRGEDSRGQRASLAVEQRELSSQSQRVSGVESGLSPPTPPALTLCLPAQVCPREACHSQGDPCTVATRLAGRWPQLTGLCPTPLLS